MAYQWKAWFNLLQTKYISGCSLDDSFCAKSSLDFAGSIYGGSDAIESASYLLKISCVCNHVHLDRSGNNQLIDLRTTKLVEYDGNFYCIREEITSWTFNFFAYGRIVLVSISPLIVITVLYSAIAVTLRRQNISLRCTAVKKNDQRKRQAVKMSLCIIVSFNLCVTPYIVFGMAYLSGEKLPCSVNGLLGFFSVLGIYLSSTTNPLICFLFVKNYRRGLRWLFSSCPSNRRDSQNLVREQKMNEINIQIIEFNKLRKTDESP